MTLLRKITVAIAGITVFLIYLLISLIPWAIVIAILLGAAYWLWANI